MRGQHESKDANIRALVQSGAGLALLLAVAMVAMKLLFGYLAAQPAAPSSALTRAEEPIPQPRLQVTPAGDLRARRAYEDSILNSYRWVDRNSAVVGIPIERAMDLFADKKLGARPENEVKR
jgi:hypothetical protein